MKITVPLVRDLAMLGLGTGTLTREFFLIGDTPPDHFRVYVGIALLMGPTAILGAWQAWLALRRPTDVTALPMASTPTADSSSQSPSHLPLPPSSP